MTNSKGERKKGRWHKPVAIVAIIIVCIIYFFPIFWMIVNSFKNLPDITDIPPKWFFIPILKNYWEVVWTTSPTTGAVVASPFTHMFINSFALSLGSTAISLIVGILAGYSFSRFDLRGKNTLMFFILSTRMLPPISIIIPTYIMFRTLGLYNTHHGMILLYVMFNQAFAVWIIKGFFDEVPRELEEAFMVDGYSRIRSFFKVTLPQASTGIAATAIFCMLSVWNEFLAAYTLTGYESRTIPVLISLAGTTEIGTRWGYLCALGTVHFIPILIFAILIQPYLLRGITFGTIKGGAT